MSTGIVLAKPTFVKDLPATQRAALAPKKSELDAAVEKFVAQLMDHRDEWAVAVRNVVSTSSPYEAFRKAGCEVRVVRQTDPKSGAPVVERRKNSKGEDTDYPVCDIYVMLPAGPIVNRSKRQPWVAPKTRIQEFEKELAAGNVTAERRAEISLQLEKIYERNAQPVQQQVERLYEKHPDLRPSKDAAPAPIPEAAATA